MNILKLRKINFLPFPEIRVVGNKTVKVVGWIDRDPSSKGWKYKSLIIHCNDCAKDREMYPIPLFRTSPNAVKDGFGSCGCSKRAKLTGRQIIIKAKRIAKDRGYTVNGIIGDFKGYLTKLSLSCPVHGDWHHCSIDNFSRGRGCPSCEGLNPTFSYVVKITRGNQTICLKYGVTSNPDKRLYRMNWDNREYKSTFIGVWKYQDWKDCVNSERECKGSIPSGVLNFTGGQSETFEEEHLEDVIKIYEKFGGALQD